MNQTTIAALYIDERHSPYLTRLAECWGITRDARNYQGPHPVIAHPPCGPHGRYHSNCNQDFTLAEIALNQVRRFSGIFEHPKSSHLARQLRSPQHDLWDGFTITIDQHRFGHLAQKLTTLYLVNPRRVPAIPLARTGKAKPLETLSRLQRRLTPPDLADWLIEALRG